MTYRLLYFLIKLISYIPFRVLYIMADVLGFAAYHLMRYRRSVVRRNLTECFPEKSPAEIRKIEHGFYRFMADNIVESIKMASMSSEQMSRRMKFTNIDELNTRLTAGRSVALYLGHYANWEWVSSMPLHLTPCAVAAQIYHPLHSKSFDELMLRLRSRMGAVCVEMRNTARYVTRQKTEGKVCIVGFIADQSPRKRDARHFLEFMHHDTPVLTGTEKITKHYDFDTWYADVRRVRRGYYETTFVQMHDDPKSLPDFELTAIYYNLLEHTIRRRPELYLWSHKRFKHGRLIRDSK